MDLVMNKPSTNLFEMMELSHSTVFPGSVDLGSMSSEISNRTLVRAVLQCALVGKMKSFDVFDQKHS